MATIRGPVEPLLDLMEGRADGDALFFSRRLKIEGSMDAVVSLRNALDAAPVSLPFDALPMPSLEKTLDGDNKIAGMFTGDVIGTELALDDRPDKAEIFSEDDHPDESEAKAIDGTQDTGEAEADKAREAREEEEKVRRAAKTRKIIDDANDDLEQDLLNPSASTPSTITDDSDASTAEGEGERSAAEKAVEKVAAPDGR